MIRGSNKLKNYRLWWLSRPLRLVKFEPFWIQVCAIVAVSGIPGDISLFSLEFDRVFLMIFYRDFLLLAQKFLLFCWLLSPPFYSVILGSRGTIDSLPLLPGYQSPFCAHHPEGWAFPCFSYFPPFGAVSLKAHGWLSIPGCAEGVVLDFSFFFQALHPFRLSFWSISFFVIFPK